jgi:hypothetical protein
LSLCYKQRDRLCEQLALGRGYINYKQDKILLNDVD